MGQQIQVQNTYRNIIQLALPISIAILIPQLNMLTNTVFLGNYKPSHHDFSTQDLLAASGIAGIYYLTIVMVGYGLVSGMLMLMSRRAGENDAKGLGKILSNGIILCLALSAILIALSWLIAPWIFRLAIHEKSIQTAAISFIQIRCWGLPFIMLCQLSNSFFLATSNSKKIIMGSVVQTVVNIAMDYVCIFGAMGVPEMGLNGTAFASVMSEVVYFVVVFLIIHRTKNFKPYAIVYFKNIDFPLMKETIIKSSPLIIQYLLSIGAWEVFFIFVEHLGKAESAVSQILRSVFSIVGVVTWALGSTSNSMVSNLIGQGEEQKVIPLIKKIITISLSISLILGLPIVLFPTYFLSLLTTDVSLVEMGKVSLRIVVFATWMLSISTICFNGVLGTGNTRINMVFEFIAIILYITYISVVVEYLHLPLPYAWCSEFVYWLSLFIMSSLYLYSGRWKASFQTQRTNQ